MIYCLVRCRVYRRPGAHQAQRSKQSPNQPPIFADQDQSTCTSDVRGCCKKHEPIQRRPRFESGFAQGFTARRTLPGPYACTQGRTCCLGTICVTDFPQYSSSVTRFLRQLHPPTSRYWTFSHFLSRAARASGVLNQNPYTKSSASCTVKRRILVSCGIRA